MAQKTSALICPGTLFSPGQWRRRRKHQNTFTKIVMACVLQVPMTTATKAAKLQPERNVAQPERSVVELVPQHACCSGPAPAQRRRSTTRHCIKDWMTNKSKYRKIPHKGKRTLKIVRQYHLQVTGVHTFSWNPHPPQFFGFASASYVSNSSIAPRVSPVFHDVCFDPFPPLDLRCHQRFGSVTVHRLWHQQNTYYSLLLSDTSQ